jgi:hypothetical protein
MNLPTLVYDPPGAFRRIVAAWQEQQEKRAYGGMWALAGYSFQAGVYLLDFCRNLIAERPLPSIEELSDIVCPADGRLIAVIQVKRTLTRDTLKRALSEFALILQLVRDRNELGLLDSLRFQVACRRREPNVVWPWPLDATSYEETFTKSNTVTAFLADPFIVEQADPIGDLWALLWANGVRDPQHTINAAAGRLLDSFGRPEFLPALHRDLVSLFESAPRRAEKSRVGTLLHVEDVRPDPEAVDSRRYVVGGGFGFKEVREGCFKPRPRIFNSLRAEFERWLADGEDRLSEREIPILWIDGRSGEGKSVLLRQLVAHVLLYQPDRLPIFEVSRELVPQALKERRDAGHVVLLAVDDLYAIGNREAWDESLSHLLETDLPPVFILTCGPTEQREEFERRFAEPIRVTRFTVPQLDEEERQQFIDWFSLRVGRARKKTQVTENALLVQVMFELSEGTTLVEFSRRFRRRIERAGALLAVQRILALSSLYLETPVDLLTQSTERDAIRRLSAADQLHFRLGNDSVDFAHAHLAGEILRPVLEASYSQIPWEIAWARVLSIVLAVPHETLPSHFHQRVVERFASTPRLAIPSRARALAELYEIHLAANQGLPAFRLLATWLSTLVQYPDTQFSPSPIDRAICAIGSDELSDQVLPDVVAPLWGLAHRTAIAKEELGRLCWRVLLRSGHGHHIVAFLRQASYEQAHRERALEWLEKNVEDPQAYALLAALVNDAPQDAGIRRRALAWLNENYDSVDAFSVLVACVNAEPADSAVRERAVGWLQKHREHGGACYVLAALVKAAFSDEGIREHVAAWLNRNPGNRYISPVLAACLKAAPCDVDACRHALGWLNKNPENAYAFPVLVALVNAAPNNVEIRRRAFAWLKETPEDVNAFPVLVALVNAAPDDAEIRGQVTAWLERNPKPSYAGPVLAAILKAKPTDPEILRSSIAWLRPDPEHAYASAYLLVALVNAQPNDATIRARAVTWLEQNRHHPYTSSFLLTALVNAQPNDATIRSRAVALLLEQNSGRINSLGLLTALACAAPNDTTIREFAMNWLAMNSGQQNSSWLLTALLKTAPSDPEIQRHAGAWLEKNPRHAYVPQVLALLLSAAPDDAAIWTQAVDWLEKNPRHVYAPQVLIPLVRFSPHDREIRSHALAWLEKNPENPRYLHVLVVVLRPEPNDAPIRAQAVDWLQRNPGHTYAPKVLAPLLSAAPNDATIRTQAVDWLKKNPSHAYAPQVLIPLLRVSPNDGEIRACATVWLDQNRENTLARRVDAMLKSGLRRPVRPS